MALDTPKLLTCPLCDDAHALTPVDAATGTVYRCDRTDREIMLMPPEHTVEVTGARSLSHDSSHVFSRSQALADSASSAGPDTTSTSRASVVDMLRSRHMRRPEPEPTPPEPEPELKAKYAMEQDLATGGMGKVSLVRDVDLNRKVAMKTLLAKFTDATEYVSRFVEEAQIIGQLEHPNITPLYELGVNLDGSPYFTMKYVQGETLAEVIDRLRNGDEQTHREYSFQRRVQIIQQVCDALAFAHCKGVLHRDLKPANIMIGRYGEVQVMDWGISKTMERRSAEPPEPGTPCAVAAEESRVQLNSLAPAHETPGHVEGTAYYMSPEQVAGDEAALAPTSDVYALGSVLYELLSLRRAHPGQDLADVLRAVLSQHPQPMANYRHPSQDRVPIALQHVVDRAMEKKIEDRYQSIVEFRDALQRYLDGNIDVCCPVTAAKSSLASIDRLLDNHGTKVLIALAAIVLLLAAGVVALAVT